ncbi:unnamed protein product, partial [Mesorhabditis spiculigera]
MLFEVNPYGHRPGPNDFCSIGMSNWKGRALRVHYSLIQNSPYQSRKFWSRKLKSERPLMISRVPLRFERLDDD